MSSDNGIYILESPKHNSKEKEYRVIHTQNIEDIFHGEDVYLSNGISLANCTKVIRFARSIIYENEKDALERAHELLNDLVICEYGIVVILDEHPFPNIGFMEAFSLEEAYWQMKDMENIDNEYGT